MFSGQKHGHYFFTKQLDLSTFSSLFLHYLYIYFIGNVLPLVHNGKYFMNFMISTSFEKWYQSSYSHFAPSKKTNECIFQTVELLPLQGTLCDIKLLAIEFNQN